MDNLTSKYFCSWTCIGIVDACMSSPTSELLTFSENLKHWRLGCQHTIEPSKHMFQQDEDQHWAASKWVALKWAVPSWFSLALIQLGEIKNRPEVVAPNPKVNFSRKYKCFLMCTINSSWVKSCQCKNWSSKFLGFSLLATQYLFVLNTIVFLLVNLRTCICSVWMSESRFLHLVLSMAGRARCLVLCCAKLFRCSFKISGLSRCVQYKQCI